MLPVKSLRFYVINTKEKGPKTWEPTSIERIYPIAPPKWIANLLMHEFKIAWFAVHRKVPNHNNKKEAATW